MFDLINSMFQLFGGLFILLDVKVLLRDKVVRGVSLVSAAFFTTWGFWSLIWYIHLGTPWSLGGAIFAEIASMTWLVLTLYYRRKERLGGNDVKSW